MRSSPRKSFRGYGALVVSARPILLALSLLIAPAAMLAQSTGSITGKVTDEKGDALPGANVVLKGTATGAASSLDGTYIIANVPAGSYTVVASFVGYKTKPAQVTVAAGEQATANFSLKEDIFLSEETVVTGIASRSSKDVAEVAVARVAAAEYTASNNYQSVSQLISGKIAGVNLAPTSGNVGAGFRFNVRSGGGLNGDEQPVIYLDGVRLDDAQFLGFGAGGQGISLLSSLNPEDIEKIEVLKGPAGAALYGTGGSNGAVLITTKRGKVAAGERGGVAIDYKAVTGWNKQSFEYDAADYVSARNANNVFRTGDIIQHTLNASGGIPTLKYFASFDKREEEGHTRNNKLDRTNLRANVDVVPNQRLTFRINAGYTLNELLRPNNDNNILGYLGNTLLFPTPFAFTDSAAIENIFDKTNSNRFTGSVSAEYTPYKNLFGRVSVGVDNDNLRQDRTFPLNFVYPVAQLNQGERSIFNRRNLQFTYSLDARYSYNLTSSLNGSTVVGSQLLNRRLNTNFIQKFNIPSELISNVGAGATLSSGDEAATHRREAGIFAETSLTYKDQYYLTLGIRRDYASVVGRKAPSIDYPKASLAVRMDKYDFLPSQFGLLKLRAAYGEAGILPDLLDGLPLLWRAEGGGAGRGAVLSTIGNADIEPERVKELEMGFEAELFTNYSVDFTYYRQTIRESIVGFRNSPSTGQIATAKPINIGESQGSGVEVQIQASPIRGRNFGLELNLIGNYQTNEVKDLGGAQPIFDGFDSNVIKEGLPKHEFFVREVLGARFNADGTYAGPRLTTDRVSHGNPIPKYTGSLTVNVNFLKNFNFYALADWATELKIHNRTNVFAYRFGNGLEFNRIANQLDRAGKPGVASFSAVDATIPRLTPGTPEYQQAAERFARLDHTFTSNFIEDGDFLKLREISLTYSFKDLLPKFFAGSYVKDFVVGFSVRNVWTTTKYSGPDVEVNHNGARTLTRGDDFLTLQNPRAYNLTFKVSL